MPCPQCHIPTQPQTQIGASLIPSQTLHRPHRLHAIQQLANIFAVADTYTPNPTSPPSFTRAATLFPMPWENAEPHAPPRVSPAVLPPRVELPYTNPPHSYPLLSRTHSNLEVEAVGEGTVAFQGVLDPATVKMQGYTPLIRGPAKDTCNKEFSNNIDRLAQGMGKHKKGANTIFHSPVS